MNFLSFPCSFPGRFSYPRWKREETYLLLHFIMGCFLFLFVFFLWGKCFGLLTSMEGACHDLDLNVSQRPCIEGLVASL